MQFLISMSSRKYANKIVHKKRTHNDIVSRQIMRVRLHKQQQQFY